MPASLYNLANRKHHSETQAEVAPTIVVDNAAVAEQIVDSSVVLPANAVASDEAAAVQESETAQEPAAENAEAADEKISYPAWDVSWSKTQLLAVAQSLNLSVTSLNTKTEIINALTSAAKA